MWRVSVTALVCAIVGSVIACSAWIFRAPELIPESAVGFCLVTIMLVFQLAIPRLRQSKNVSEVFFVLTYVTMIIITSLNHERYIEAHYPFEPYIGYKILAVFVPLLCPPSRWPGWVTLTILAVLPVERYYMWNSDARAALGIQEPWVTLIVVACSGVIYCYRLKAAENLRSEIALETRSKSLQRFAHLLLSAQHLMNTPLQSIEIIVHSIGLKFPDSIGMIKKFDQAFASIKRVSEALSSSNDNIRWDEVDLPDTAEELKTELMKLSTS